MLDVISVPFEILMFALWFIVDSDRHGDNV